MSIIDWLHKAEQHAITPEAEPQGLAGRVIDALRTVYDPELPVNIYDLGLVYGLDVDEAVGKVRIRMTLTAPGCPVAQTFPATVEGVVEAVEGVNDARVELVWEPPWSRDRMSEAARLDLGMI
jgi:FeS assembly SUF system protein